MSMPDWAGIAGVLAGIAGLAGGLGALVKIKPERAKLEAEAVVLVSNQSISMAAKLEERLNTALARIDLLEENEDRWREALAAHHQWDNGFFSKTLRPQKSVTSSPL